MKRSIQKKLWYFFRKPFPVIKNTVFFESFGGQYNDNPKYISEKLHDIDSSISIVWATSPKSKQNAYPKYVKTVAMDSDDYKKYSCRSEVLVTNMNGFRGFVSVKSAKFLANLFKSNRQLNISTWHGTPLKHIGLDVPGMEQYCYMNTSSDYIVAGCKYTYDIFIRAFNPCPIKLTGTPRNDILVNIDECGINRIKADLGLPKNKKIILFAPTFRDSYYESGIRQAEELDFTKLFRLISEKFGGEWCFVFRVHHMVIDKINFDELSASFGNDKFINGNLHDDMAEYLAASDILLTDYSSSLYDFMLTRRPCFLLTLDRKHYIDEERGVYMSLDQLPYSYADSCEELYTAIEDYDYNHASQQIEDFLRQIGNAEDGKSSERIANHIIDFIRTGNKPK